MKKSLLLAVAALMLGAANAQAETAYGLMSGYPSWSVCSYDWDALGDVNAEKVFDVPFSDVQAGTSVGNGYYAYGIISDYETYMDNLYFASINMQSQETVLIKNFGDVWGENGFTIRDLASDGTNLYGLKDNNYWSDEIDDMVYSSDLVKVNLENGSFETVANFNAICWGLTYQDGSLYVVVRGGLKGWSYLIDLCKVEADYSLTQLTNNTEVACSEMMPSHAAATPSGICFFAGATPILFDVANGTATEIEDAVTRYQSYAGTTFTQSSESGEGGNDEPAEEAATRVLVSVSSFGDYMGTAPDDKLTAQRVYYYNQNLQVVAVIESATNANETFLYTQHYNPYVYDENGKLIKKDSYQYGLYDYGDRAMHQSAGVIEYTYDAAGNCIEELSDGNLTTYEYDAEGNCVKEVHSANGNVGKTIVYSGFIAKNKPTLASASHTNETFTGEFYDEEREYDDQGRLVKATRVCNRDYVEDHGFWQISTAAGDFLQEEHWTYEGKQIALYEKFNSINEETGELMPYLKTVYTVKDENTVGYQSYTAFGDEWYKSGVYQEETYLEFAGMTDITALELVSVTKAENGVNNANIEFTVPMIAYFNTNVGFNIFRNGELINTVSLMDAFEEGSGLVINEENGNLIYSDTEIPSGIYDYFVQVLTVEGGVEPLADDVDPGFNVDPLNYTGYCTSNIVSVDLTLELPAATNVRILANEKDSNNDNHVTIGFNAPVYDEALGFISNELLVNNAQVSEEVATDPEQTQLHYTSSSDTATVYILTRYVYGKAVSERVTVDVNNIPVTGIELVRELGAEGMLIFDAAGRQVNAPIESLHGNYIVVSGNVAHKVVLK